MSINKTYAVIGLGRYGVAVAKRLCDSGAEVLAVDIDETIVSSLAGEIPYCKCADITDPEAFEALGIGNMDVVIISMANSLEASVMAITLCKEAGVGTVIAKCGSEMHKKIFTRVGADRVVFPESESGTRLAKNLLSAGFVDMVEISDKVSIVEMNVPSVWVGKTLIDLHLRKNYGINIIAIKHKGEVFTTVSPEKPLEADMKLTVIANVEKLAKFI